MVFSLSEEERYIFSLIGSVAESLGYPAYLVGGYVRDRLLARPCKDIDVVCVGSGIRMAEEVAARLHPIPRVAVFKRFGTAMLRYKSWEIEFVGARKESYRQDSRKPSVEEGSLEDDLHRRDFTINAMAISLNEKDFGTLLDPFNGLKDMEERIMRTPLEPGKTFSDDPLRMLRGIRFATQLNFTIAPDTYASITQHHKRLQIISKERISTELNKIILAHQPSLGFRMLFETGLLGQFFPEMVQLHGVETMQGRSHKDNFFHTLQVLDNLSKNTDNLWLRWAAILHDIAKPATKKFDPEAGWTFHGHDAVGANMVPKIFRRLKLPLDHQMRYVQKLVALHLRPISLTKENITDSAIRRLLFDAGEDLDDLMLLCQADITSKNREKVKRYLENYELVMERLKAVEEEDHIRSWQPPVSGELIMETFGITPSREVGIIKNAIKDAILDGDIPNTFDAAYHFMLQKGMEIGLSSKK
jgi:putative nucleotidyltransferase with HDIG domain